MTARRWSVLRELLGSEAVGGLVLLTTAVVAIGIANSPLSGAYDGILHQRVAGLDLLHWVNDGLMAVFFLFVGLEIKRELLDGQLSTWPRRVLPGAAALGGMIAPALVYLAFNWQEPGAARGMAIPAATDIAFALGVIALLGSRVPASLKVFLTALAILDDVGAVTIIALFYTEQVSVTAMAVSGVILAALVALNRMGVTRLGPYLVLGAALWIAVLQSGVHATIAGVLLALTIPLRAAKGHVDDAGSPLHRLEHGLAPWVAFMIMPVFGFANAGVSFAGIELDAVFAAVPLGIAAGLFLGKQLGVFLFSWVVIRLGWARLPRDAGWMQLYGVAVVCGVGFTMSLFIGLMAFDAADQQVAVKVGVLVGSLFSGVAGLLVLGLSSSRRGGSRSAQSLRPNG